MATSVLDVWNMALSNVGVTTTIESLIENTKERKACSRWYQQCLDYVLRDRYWGMATKSEVLALIAGQSYPGYRNVYAYPSDCLFLRAVTDSAGDRLVQGNIFATAEDLNLIPVRVPFKIISKADLTAQAIATDLDGAYGVFTARIIVPAVWGPTFTEALAYRLAYKIAPVLNVEASMIDQMLKLYNHEVDKASEADLNEQRPDQEPDSPSVAIRG